jgi:hypothetical protein
LFNVDRQVRVLPEEPFLLSEAEEWIDYNMAGAYLGPDAPVIVKMGGEKVGTFSTC